MRQHPPEHPKAVLKHRSFWILVIMLAVLGALHYLTPQTRPLPFAPQPLERHAVERIVFILPVAAATFAFGQAGGLTALALSLLIMLPRVFLLSPYPVDALLEVAAVGVVGYLMIWMIAAQEREKKLRQEAVLRLRAVSAVTEEITSELELDRVLPKVLQAARSVVGADGGAIALFDPEHNRIRYPYLDNLPPTLSNVTASHEEGLSWEVMTTGKAIVIENYPAYPRAIPAFVQAGVTAVAAVPISHHEKSFGALALVTFGKLKTLSERDLSVLSGIGRQAGVAIANAQLYENLRSYARQITRAQEEERERIARDLHDETIQMLIAASRRLEMLATMPERLPKPAMRQLANLQDMLNETTRGLRQFVQDLRPSTLDRLGLVAALVGLAKRLQEEDGITTEVKVNGEPRRLAPEQELGLFRILQEALTNVRKHAGATHVTVEVTFHPKQVHALVHDDGSGFDTPERLDGLSSSGKLGLIGMVERARLMGGTMSIHSTPGEGTTVLVQIPAEPV